MAQVTTYPLPCRYPLPLAPAPSTRAMSRATEGFSASTATLPDSAATIVLFQSGIRLRLMHPVGETEGRLFAAGNAALARHDRPRKAMVCPTRFCDHGRS